jgi:hypothetical protein
MYCISEEKKLISRKSFANSLTIMQMRLNINNNK